MNPSDLLAETVFGKRTSSKKHHPAGPPFWGPKFGPQSGGPYNKKWIRGPRFGVRNLDPKTGSDQRSSPNRNCWGSQFILQRVDGQDDSGT